MHFALVSISLGLILILSSKGHDTMAAAAQMAEVVQINAVWPKERLADNSENMTLEKLSVATQPVNSQLATSQISFTPHLPRIDGSSPFAWSVLIFSFVTSDLMFTNT